MNQDLHDLLNEIRDNINNMASNSEDRKFYINRFIYARLQLDERKEKQKIKNRIFENNRTCSHCKKEFETLKYIHLHRIDASKGYTDANCELLHSQCHKKVHSDQQNKEIIKRSRLHDNQPYLYWWDFTPSLKEKIFSREIEMIKFVKKDTGEYCIIGLNSKNGGLKTSSMYGTMGRK